MQRAIVVRINPEKPVNSLCSYEVEPKDRSRQQPLRELLDEGWCVVHSCPMSSDLDNCCLLILEKPATKPQSSAAVADEKTGAKADSKPQADAKPRTDTQQTPPANPAKEQHHLPWDGESISLDAFGLPD